PRGGGGRMNNKLESNPEAVGSHTTFQRGANGKIHKYETYERTSSGHFNPRRRYDVGKPDGSPGKPHITEKQAQQFLLHTYKERKFLEVQGLQRNGKYHNVK